MLRKVATAVFGASVENHTHKWVRPAGRARRFTAPLFPKIGGCSPVSRGPVYRVFIAFPLRSLCSALVPPCFLGALKSRVPSWFPLGSRAWLGLQSPQFCGQSSGHCPVPGGRDSLTPAGGVGSDRAGAPCFGEYPPLWFGDGVPWFGASLAGGSAGGYRGLPWPFGTQTALLVRTKPRKGPWEALQGPSALRRVFILPLPLTWLLRPPAGPFFVRGRFCPADREKRRGCPANGRPPRLCVCGVCMLCMYMTLFLCWTFLALFGGFCGPGRVLPSLAL